MRSCFGMSSVPKQPFPGSATPRFSLPGCKPRSPAPVQAQNAQNPGCVAGSGFNLDVIISVGYRVKSLRGTQFRQWATRTLREHLR